MNFVEELSWRGMVHDIMPGTEEQLQKELTAGYVGFDPTADSLHIGNLVPIMLLTHLQRSGHKPIALVGGATGMVGDPSGKSEERNLLSVDILRHNADCVKKQLEFFLDFEKGENSAEMVNNYDWFGEMNFLDFIRDVGKHLSINYMLAKDSVKNRLEKGMSFTEFSYQLVQGYDFYWLYKNKGCRLQMGGSDQWGNITTGSELIGRIDGGKAYALTCPLITKSDGGKFGKSEKGNVWLDKSRTSPFQFYQFWFNSADEDVIKFAKIFSLKSREEIEATIKEHEENLGRRILQKALGEELTERLHGSSELDKALAATGIMFGKPTRDDLLKLDPEQLEDVFSGVDSGIVGKDVLGAGISLVDLLVEGQAFNSKGEARRFIQQGGLKINTERCTDFEQTITSDDVINGKFIFVQKGKKTNHILYIN